MNISIILLMLSLLLNQKTLDFFLNIFMITLETKNCFIATMSQVCHEYTHFYIYIYIRL